MTRLAFGIVALVVAFPAPGCADEPTLLLVDLRTDLIPGQEFSEVEIEFGESGVPIVVPVSSGQDFLAGVRLAEIDTLDEGPVTFDVYLRTSVAFVQSRRVRVQLEGRVAVTVLITRDCAGVTCEDPGFEACLNGRCVATTCTEESPCEPVCATDADCDTESSCDVPRCVAGVCLVGADPGACAAPELCVPDRGCAALSRGTVPTTDWVDTLDATPYGVGVSGGTGAAFVTGEVFSFSDEVPAISGDPPADLGSQSFLLAYDVSGIRSWGEVFGGVGDGTESEFVERGLAVALDAAGNVYVGGSAASAVDFGDGAPRPGVSEGNGYIASYDPSGVLRWAIRFGESGANSRTRAVHVDAMRGQVFAGGDFRTAIVTPTGRFDNAGAFLDGFVAAFTLDGAPVWSTDYGVMGSAEVGAIVSPVPGDVTAVVTVGGTIRPDGFRGSRNEAVAFSPFDTAGAPLAVAEVAASTDGMIAAAAATALPAGSVVIGGSYSGPSTLFGDDRGDRGIGDGYVASVRPDGSLAWSVDIGDRRSDYVYSVAVDVDGNVYATGEFEGAADFGGGLVRATQPSCQLFVASWDPDGNHRWSTTYDTARESAGHGIGVDDNGGVVVVGFANGDVDLGTGDQPIGGGFVLRLRP